MQSIPVGHLKLNAAGQPIVTTIYGDIEESRLRRETNIDDNEDRRTIIICYFLAGECVHRSTHVQLKKGLGIEGMLGAVG